MKCVACKSEDVVRAKNDSGFVKTEKHKPRRMYNHVCNACGFVHLMVEVVKT